VVLLRRYADHQDESAFAELVRRNVDLVHSASLRRIGDCSLAEDVPQATFMILARKAKSIRQHRQETLRGFLRGSQRFIVLVGVKCRPPKRPRCSLTKVRT
jgi:DNA-directed RNA polymerase specialized sigma24 family protein